MCKEEPGGLALLTGPCPLPPPFPQTLLPFAARSMLSISSYFNQGPIQDASQVFYYSAGVTGVAAKSFWWGGTDRAGASEHTV